VRGLLTFTSNRSLEIEVIVEYESIFSKQSGIEASTVREKAVDAFFTFVSIDDSGQALPVPLLEVNGSTVFCVCLSFIVQLLLLLLYLLFCISKRHSICFFCYL